MTVQLRLDAFDMDVPASPLSIALDYIEQHPTQSGYGYTTVRFVAPCGAFGEFGGEINGPYTRGEVRQFPDQIARWLSEIWKVAIIEATA